MNFEFSESSHIYKVNGQVVPSVTRVLDHAGLVDYSMIREEILERASDRGKRVHTACHYYDENDLAWDTVHADDAGFVQSWIRFCEITHYTPHISEQQSVFSHDGHLCGMRLDSAGFFRGSSRLAIVDRKTGEVNWWTGVQLAGYAIGLTLWPTETPVLSPLSRFLRRDRYAVRLYQDGHPGKLIPFLDKSDYYDFTAALYLTHRKLARGMRIREEAAEHSEARP